MFKTILVPTDGSPLSEKAIDAAVRFAKQNRGKIIGISVAEPYPIIPVPEAGGVESLAIYNSEMQELAKLHVQKIADAAQAAEVPVETTVAESPNPYEEIIKAARDYQCDVIFMASHGRKGLSSFFLGSETQRVLTHSSIPVLVFR